MKLVLGGDDVGEDLVFSAIVDCDRGIIAGSIYSKNQY